MIRGCYSCPWKLQRDLEEVLKYKDHFWVITHYYREANTPTDRLANIGVDLESDFIFGSFATLPGMVRGDTRLDRLRFPSFCRKVGKDFFVLRK